MTELTPIHAKLTPSDMACESDVKRLVEIAAKNGFRLSASDARYAWDWHSDADYCAGWMPIPEDDSEAWDAILPYLMGLKEMVE